MDDGYNITLTDAPNDLGGRLRLNCALTTPELPIMLVNKAFSSLDDFRSKHTMRTGHLPPYDPYFCPSNFSLCAVDEGDFLSQVKAIDVIAQYVHTSCRYQENAYVAAFESSTPSILINLLACQNRVSRLLCLSNIRGPRVCVALSPLIAQMFTPTA